MRDPDIVGPELRHVVVVEVNAVRAPHVFCEPADVVQVFDRRAAV